MLPSRSILAMKTLISWIVLWVAVRNFVLEEEMGYVNTKVDKGLVYYILSIKGKWKGDVLRYSLQVGGESSPKIRARRQVLASNRRKSLTVKSLSVGVLISCVWLLHSIFKSAIFFFLSGMLGI